MTSIPSVPAVSTEVEYCGQITWPRRVIRVFLWGAVPECIAVYRSMAASWIRRLACADLPQPQRSSFTPDLCAWRRVQRISILIRLFP